MKISRALRTPTLPPPNAKRDDGLTFKNPVSHLPQRGAVLGEVSRSDGGGCFAFVGAGGKTTAMFQLARELAVATPVIVTATAHLGVWQIPFADQHVIVRDKNDLENFEPRGQRFPSGGVTLITGPIESDRTSPLDSESLYWLHAEKKIQHIPLLIEADGSRNHPLKAPEEHEPPIPDFADTVIVVAGLSGLGESLNANNVHRPHLFSTLSGLSVNQRIASESLTRVLTHPRGGLKNIPAYARRIAMLNQAETSELQALGGRMARELLNAYDSVLVGSAQQNEFQVFEKAAGIILAAGAATRFGQHKQLLDWRGQSFVRAVAQNAISAGLSPVIAVTGAYADKVKVALEGLDVFVVENKEWESGQASSIRAGIKFLTPSRHPPNPQGATGGLQEFLNADLGEVPRRGGGGRGEIGSSIFLLADQPHIGTDILRALVAEHTTTLAPIIAPLVLEERRANPVLFDCVAFPDLLKLEGDVGGRAIFDKHLVHYLPWHDDRLLLDVDTPEDYARLINDESL